MLSCPSSTKVLHFSLSDCLVETCLYLAEAISSHPALEGLNCPLVPIGRLALKPHSIQVLLVVILYISTLKRGNNRLMVLRFVRGLLRLSNSFATPSRELKPHLIEPASMNRGHTYRKSGTWNLNPSAETVSGELAPNS